MARTLQYARAVRERVAGTPLPVGHSAQRRGYLLSSHQSEFWFVTTVEQSALPSTSCYGSYNGYNGRYLSIGCV